MKKILLLAAAAIMAVGMMQAKTADELRIYLNPGHGSFGSNDRPMNTIGHPNTTQLTDTFGFYEGRGTLPRAFGLGETLVKMGVKRENIVYSRLTNGPWPKDNGEDAEKYNRNLADICEEVEAGNFDMFISSHSNAATDGTTTNYPLTLFRGYNNGKTGDAGYNGNAVEGSYAMAMATWGPHWMNELDPTSHYSMTSPNVQGDISFYGSYSTSTRSNGKQYAGYLGVLKHGTPGYLLEGFFHTYQPARHRALNFDYDRQEGRREARGVGNYFGLTPLSTGDIMGSVRDMHEKIQENLYSYAPGTYDQWLPLNGAEVTLSKNGSVIKTYTCDNEYNGIFVFEDLEPGVYTLNVTHDGYKALGNFIEDKTIDATNTIEPTSVNITVKANETVYSKLFLEKEDYEPVFDAFVNYPEPELPGYMGLADSYTFTGETTANFNIAGKVTSVAQIADTTFILSNEGLTPHIYMVNSKTQELIKELSVNGIVDESEDNLGFLSPLYALTTTADQKLVGVSRTLNQFSAAYVDAGYKRNTARVYIWNDFNSDPSLWFSTQNAGNYYRAVVGDAIAVNGPSTDCNVLILAQNRGARPWNLRLVHAAMIDGQLAGSIFHDNLYNGTVNGGNIKGNIFGDVMLEGTHYQLAVSPNGDEKTILAGQGFYKESDEAEAVAVKRMIEFTTPVASAGNPSNVKELPESDIVLYGANFFKFAGKSVMIAPYATDGAVKGIKLFDITDGVQNAKTIEVKGGDLTAGGNSAPLRAPADGTSNYSAATSSVTDADINAYLTIDNDVTKFIAKADEQPGVKGIFAYNLKSHGNENKDWTFSFDANSDANEAFITLYDMESGEEVGTLPLTDVKEGANEFTFASEELPGEDGQRMNWDVTLKGNNIPTIAILNDLSTGEYTYTAGTQMFAAIDNSPESDYFGRIYASTRLGSGVSTNGMWAYDQQWNRINSSVLNGGQTFGSPYRLDVDAEGFVYLPDWGDPHSGVYVVDPSNLEGPMNQFFMGTRAASGLFKNADDEIIGSSSTAISIVGSGAETKAYIHAEDNSNDVAVYQLGQADGSILREWSEAPTWLGIGAKLANGNVNLKGDLEHGGVWVSQIRGAGNNAAGVPSLMFVTDDGTIQFNSGSDLKDLNGSMGGGFAISRDGSTLAIHNGSAEVEFFDIIWDGNKPIVTPKGYSFKSDVRRADGSSHNNYMYQMQFDWGGNLVCTGSRMGIYSMPTDNNQNTTPAKKALIVRKGRTTGVNAVADAQRVKIVVTPNPTSGLATVKGVEVTDLKVYNLNGALVARSNNESVDLSNLAAGVYLIKVNGGEAVRVIKK